MESKIQTETIYGPIAPSMFERLAKIRLLMLDVDGTLTDGGVYLDNGEGEFKKFYTKDGLGIVQLQRTTDCTCAVITGRKAHLTERRCAETHITHVIQGQGLKDKAAAELQKQLGISVDESAAIGDDLNDLPMFSRAGLSACPSDAHPYILRVADLPMHMPGGHGAVREICDLIMMAKGAMDMSGRLLK
jgi:3-deoxy-D-manno-octulosonate 8-phosphate phosphatase (KDO 8-P phosphatase)